MALKAHVAQLFKEFMNVMDVEGEQKFKTEGVVIIFTIMYGLEQ